MELHISTEENYITTEETSTSTEETCECVCVVCIRQDALYSTGPHVRFLACRILYSSGVRTQLVAGQGICNITRLTGCSSLLKASLFPLVLLRSLFYNIIPPSSSLSVQLERCGAVPPAGHMRTHQFVPGPHIQMRDPRFPQLCLPSSSHTVQ
jgi:hypothetical protein